MTVSRDVTPLLGGGIPEIRIRARRRHSAARQPAHEPLPARFIFAFGYHLAFGFFRSPREPRFCGCLWHLSRISPPLSLVSPIAQSRHAARVVPRFLASLSTCQASTCDKRSHMRLGRPPRAPPPPDRTSSGLAGARARATCTKLQGSHIPADGCDHSSG